MFVIRPGRYHIPKFGFLDTSKGVSNDQALELYEHKNFSFITITEEAVPFLKKKKLSAKRIASLIQRSKTPEEVNWLLQVKSTNTLERIAEIKIQSMQ